MFDCISVIGNVKRFADSLAVSISSFAELQLMRQALEEWSLVPLSYDHDIVEASNDLIIGLF